MLDRLTAEGGGLKRVLAPGGLLDQLLDEDGLIERVLAEDGLADRLLAEGGLIDKLTARNGRWNNWPTWPTPSTASRPGSRRSRRPIEALREAVTTLSLVVNPLSNIADRIPIPGAGDPRAPRSARSGCAATGWSATETRIDPIGWTRLRPDRRPGHASLAQW